MCIFDENNKFGVLSISNTLGTKGLEIEEAMAKILYDESTPTRAQITSGIRRKLRFVLTDRCPAQENANRLLIERLANDELRRDLPPVQQIVCMMHHVAHQEKEFSEALSTETEALMQNIRMCLGYRQGSGWKKHNLAPGFRALTKIKTPFVSTVGCRFGDTYTNSLNILEYENEVRTILDSLAEKKLKDKQKLTEKQQALKECLTSEDWPRMRLEFGLCMVMWLHITGPLHTVVSRDTSFGTVKAALMECEDKCKMILDGMTVGDVVAELKNQHMSEQARKSLALYEGWLNQSNRHELEALQETMVNGVMNLQKKVDRDVPIIRALELNHDEKVPYTNRRCESVFAVYKALHKRLMSMNSENKAAVTRARMNNTPRWLGEKSVNDQAEMLKLSGEERKMVIENRRLARERWEKEIEDKYFKDLESLVEK
ncbi:Hypothetical protein FKW44_006925 [Caligus rogercresseyi]|nr:Hypothetical protein FKW44_006925 [Caligus rogercresseyi]